MKLIQFQPSTRPTKRFMIEFDEPKRTIHFGAKNGSTYIDHKDKIKRKNYLLRHIVNEDWTQINPGSLSSIILWGRTTNLKENLKDYLDYFNISYEDI